MLISLNWIRDFAPFKTKETPVQLGARFSLHTAEVEEAVELGRSLKSIRVARVQSVESHPDADRLRIARVDLGNETKTVVCGAPNVRSEQFVPYAPPGTVVLGHTIESRKVRGVLSEGMLCSQKELDVSSDGAGLWELPDGLEAGRPMLECFPEFHDIVLEVDNKSLTHRPDLWGHYGLAREFAAIYRVDLKELEVDEGLASGSGTSAVKVSITGDGVGGRDGLCPRYCGLQIDGIEVAPSPAWLQHRLLAVGSRPINNIVDVTNYILFELGQPLHAFDTANVAGGEIEVRRASDGEQLDLLDDSSVTLTGEDLVIADGRGAVALAGIMGGAGTEISSDSTSVFLECANFLPSRVRQTSRRLGKITDSSLRFEKSLDPVGVRRAILRAAQMITDLCPRAKVVGPLQDVGFERPDPITVQTSTKFLTRRLGAKISAKKLRDSLTRLGFEVDGEGAGDWQVRVPSWRATKDISIQEDLVEEVGRIHGYDNIAPFAPVWPVATPSGNPRRLTERSAKEYLTQHAGLHEVFTYSMVGEVHCRRFGLEPDAHLKLLNPVSEELDRMRREIVPIHLEKAKENQRYFKEFGFFELGRVFRKSPDRIRERELPDERNRLAGLVCAEEKVVDNFYRVSSFVLGLLSRLRVADVEIVPPDDSVALPSWVHPAVAGVVVASGRPYGLVARVHPSIARELKMKGDVVTFDIAFDELLDSLLDDPTRRAEVDYQPPLRYPTVPFDVAVVAEARVPVRDIRRVIEGVAGEALLDARVLSVYDEVGEGKKSVAFHLVFGSGERTLSGEEVSALQKRVVGALEQQGYRLR